jgi:hypothetical protein
MNIIILSHERSLNKAEGLLNALSDQNVHIVLDKSASKEDKPYIKLANNIIVSKGFNVIDIISKVKHCDKIWCVSENLLPIQSQLESYYGIDNLSSFAAEVLSNKQHFDDYCRSIGLGEFVPDSVTPTFHSQLDRFKNKEIFTKPDIGTGSNVFFPGDNQNTPKIEYRRWNNKHHFLKHLKDKQSHNEFFDINKQGIHTQRFNYKPCKIMVQEYFWSEEPSLIPIGIVRQGKVIILCYIKTTKVKYGDILDPNLNPTEQHSNSKMSDIAKDLAVWSVDANDIDEQHQAKMQHFLQTVVDNLKIKELMFAGPDFHVSGDKLIAIDFNPRPGQFMNILDHMNSHTIIRNLIEGKPVDIKNKLLWGCAMLKSGKITAISNLDNVSRYFNHQNTQLNVGDIVPEFQNLQNKQFNINLNVSGTNEQELFNNYKHVNQLLQDCITY